MRKITGEKNRCTRDTRTLPVNGKHYPVPPVGLSPLPKPGLFGYNADGLSNSSQEQKEAQPGSGIVTGEHKVITGGVSLDVKQ